MNTQSGTGITCPALCLCEALGGPLRGFCRLGIFLSCGPRKRTGAARGLKQEFVSAQVPAAPARRCSSRAHRTDGHGRPGQKIPGGRSEGPGPGHWSEGPGLAARPMVPVPVPLPAPSEGGGTVRRSTVGLILSNRRHRRTAAESLPGIYAPAGWTREEII